MLDVTSIRVQGVQFDSARAPWYVRLVARAAIVLLVVVGVLLVVPLLVLALGAMVIAAVLWVSWSLVRLAWGMLRSPNGMLDGRQNVRVIDPSSSTLEDNES